MARPPRMRSRKAPSNKARSSRQTQQSTANSNSKTHKRPHKPNVSDDESEIDEDEAFNTEDEETFGSHFAAKSSDEHESGSDTGELLSEMLGPTSAGSITIPKDKEIKDNDSHHEVADFSGEETDEESTPSKKESLKELVLQLSAPKKSSKKVSEILEDNPVPSSMLTKKTVSDSKNELTMESLLSGFDEEDSPSFVGALHLNKMKKQISAAFSNSTSEKAILRAPTASVHEEREARKLAYTLKKKELAVFLPVVRANREKETLDLRGKAPDLDPLTPAVLTSKFRPQTSMETEVNLLLKNAKLTGHALKEQEKQDLAHNDISKEQVMQRQKELAKMRSMLFYEEQKQKRAKKIKSKLYHKIRNNKEKRKAGKEAASDVNHDNVAEMDREMLERRAEERMTLKHKNTSKWVKHQLKRGKLADDGTRTAIAEQLERGQQLRKKMESAYDEDDIDTEDRDLSKEIGEGSGMDSVEAQAENLMVSIQSEIQDNKQVKGLQGMKFMQRALEKQRERSLQEAESLLLEIRDTNKASSWEDECESSNQNAADTDEADTKDDVIPPESSRSADFAGSIGLSSLAVTSNIISVNLSDAKMSNKSSIEINTMENNAATHAAPLSTKEKDLISTSKAGQSQHFEAPSSSSADNPWLVSTGITTRNTKRRGKMESVGACVNEKIRHAVNALTESKSSETPPAHQAPVSETDVHKNSTFEAQVTEAKHETKKRKRAVTIASSQEEFVRHAFAFADAGENELAREKEAIAAQDAAIVKSGEVAKLIGMSGWGSWAGHGVPVSGRQRARQLQAQQLVEKSKKEILVKRKDSKLKHVLINEKKDKLAAKFMVNEVPYPFKCREEYETAMRNPLGSDWNTSASTSSLTAPKIIKRSGHEIEPLALTSEQKKWSMKEIGKQRRAKF